MNGLVRKSDDAALKGSQLMADGKTAEAIEQYLTALEQLPKAPMTQQRIRAYSKQGHRAFSIHYRNLQGTGDDGSSLSFYRKTWARYVGLLIGDPLMSYTRQNFPNPVMREFYHRNVNKALALAGIALFAGILRGAIGYRKGKSPNWPLFFLSTLSVPALILTVTLLGAAIGFFPHKGHCNFQSVLAGTTFLALTISVFLSAPYLFGKIFGLKIWRP